MDDNLEAITDELRKVKGEGQVSFKLTYLPKPDKWVAALDLRDSTYISKLTNNPEDTIEHLFKMAGIDY